MLCGDIDPNTIVPPTYFLRGFILVEENRSVVERRAGGPPGVIGMVYLRGKTTRLSFSHVRSED